MRTDIKKDRKDLYLPGKADFTEVDVPAMTYLAIDGHGDPNTSPAYATAIQVLYAGAYAIRAVLKKRTGDDFVVGPLEGLWTSADNAAFVAGAACCYRQAAGGLPQCGRSLRPGDQDLAVRS